MIILSCVLLIAMLALLGCSVLFANRLVEDSRAEIPSPVRWLLRTCGDYWWAPPAAWLFIMVVLTFLFEIRAGIAASAGACLLLGSFIWLARRTLTHQRG